MGAAFAAPMVIVSVEVNLYELIVPGVPTVALIVPEVAPWGP